MDDSVGMYDEIAGAIRLLSSTGTEVASGTLTVNQPEQLHLGIYTGVVTAEAGVATLTAQLGLPLMPASMSFSGSVGSEQRNRAPALRSSDSPAEAALAAFDFVYPWTRYTPWEWGGVICQQGARFTFSAIVTNNDSGQVRTVEQPGLTQEQLYKLPACGLNGPSAPVGAFHLQTETGQPYPSGFGPTSMIIPNDLNTAAIRHDMTFFANTPDAQVGRRTFMYRAQEVSDGQGQIVWSAYNNTFFWDNKRWNLFTPPAQ